MLFSMIFPGQGSHHIGMLSTFYKKKWIIKETFEEASSILKFNLWKLIEEGPISILNKSRYAQPAILTSSIAIYRLWKRESKKRASIFSGHSLGEYSALVCAKSIKFKQALAIVYKRGLLMEEISKKNHACMIILIGFKEKKIKNIIKKNFSHSNLISIASINSKKQIVISGNKNLIKKLIQICNFHKLKKAIYLPVNVASHCYLMKPIKKKFYKILSAIKFKKPIIPVINNAYVKCEQSKKNIIRALTTQLYSTVQWRQTIFFTMKKKINCFLEVGPKSILSNLLPKTVKSFSLNNEKNFYQAINFLNKK